MYASIYLWESVTINTQHYFYHPPKIPHMLVQSMPPSATPQSQRADDLINIH